MNITDRLTYLVVFLLSFIVGHVLHIVRINQ